MIAGSTLGWDVPGAGPDVVRARKTESEIAKASSIGALERLAGIGPDDEARFQFWTAYSKLAPSDALDAGVAELKRRIRARSASIG